jgi:hypothetical protein
MRPDACRVNSLPKEAQPIAATTVVDCSACMRIADRDVGAGPLSAATRVADVVHRIGEVRRREGDQDPPLACMNARRTGRSPCRDMRGLRSTVNVGPERTAHRFGETFAIRCRGVASLLPSSDDEQLGRGGRAARATR